MEWERQAESTLNAWAAAAQKGDEAARADIAPAVRAVDPGHRGLALARRDPVAG